MSTPDASLESEFVEESRERLEQIETALLHFEDLPERGSAAAVDEIYRHYHTLKGNGSYFGLRPLVDVCHASEAAIARVRDQAGPEHAGQWANLLPGIDAIRSMLADIDNADSIDVTGALAEIESAMTDVAEDSGSAAAGSVTPASDPDSPRTVPSDSKPDQSGGSPAMSLHLDEKVEPVIPQRPQSRHIDSSVYAICMLESLRHNGDPDRQSALMLAELAEKISRFPEKEGFALPLLNLLRAHPDFAHVDRVCLAAAVRDANQLVVVDSVCSKSIRFNSMKRGYSCFVDPAGSLFQLVPGGVRVFDDARRIKGQYHRENRPVQRSIANVSAMGLRSGLCLAVRDVSRVNGFLFFNSCQPNGFATIPSRHADLLSSLGVLSHTALSRVGFAGPDRGDVRLRAELSWTSCEFDTKTFGDCVRRTIARTWHEPVDVCVECSGDPRFLASPGHFAIQAAAVHEALRTTGHPPESPFRIRLHNDGQQVRWRIAHGADPGSAKTGCLYQVLRKLFREWKDTPYAVSCDEHDVTVTFAAERICESTPVRYSVL